MTTSVPPAVSVHGLVKRYGDVLALDCFGKTTAINCILALLTYDAGQVGVFGSPMTPTSYALKRRIGVVRPDLVFFDEPTVAVDPQSRNAILEGIMTLRDRGTTVVYTSHYMEEVEQICDRILILGVLERSGTNIGHLTSRPPSLNDVFLELTGTALRD